MWRHFPGVNPNFDLRALYFFARPLDLHGTPQAGRLPHFGGSGGLTIGIDVGIQTRSPLYLPIAGLGVGFLGRDGMTYATDQQHYDTVDPLGFYGYLALPGLGVRFQVGDWVVRPSLRPALHTTSFGGASLFGVGWRADLELCRPAADFVGVCLLAGSMTDTLTGAPVGVHVGLRAMFFEPIDPRRTQGCQVEVLMTPRCRGGRQPRVRLAAGASNNTV
jgi:hypothetical protein